MKRIERNFKFNFDLIMDLLANKRLYFKVKT